jgi:hypothetical protein
MLGGRNNSVGIATGYDMNDRSSNLCEIEVFRGRLDRPRGQPNLLYKLYCVIPWGKTVGAWSWALTSF